VNEVVEGGHLCNDGSHSHLRDIMDCLELVEEVAILLPAKRRNTSLENIL
jgi:hypothetical protein